MVDQEYQNDTVKKIVALAKALNCKFTIKNQEISPERAFAITGVLPAIMRRADQLATFCLGYGLGVTFERADGSILGVSVTFDNKVAISLRLLCIADVLIDMLYSSSIPNLMPLDGLMEE